MVGSDPIAAAACPATVRVRLFAGLRQAMGWGDRQLPLGSVRTPIELWRKLNPAGSGADQAGVPSPGPPGGATDDDEPPIGIRVAINQRFAAWDTPLAPGDELAFLPPISGG